MCFMLAPRHHGAMRNVGGTRVELGTRTIFNLLGPLANPAGVGRLMVGVFAREWVEPLAQVLQRLGAEHVWVVHGSDGLDEITTTGPTYVAELKQGAVTSFEITPTDANLELAEAAALKGDDAETNARALRALLDGEAGPYRDIVLLNSAATLITAGKVETLKQGVALAAEAIDAGRARDTLERLIAVSRRPPPQPENEDSEAKEE
jgi:anthranilate phosphoribosyltransferase